MSDFISGGWSIYIGAVVLTSLFACLGLLFIASRRKVMASDNSTGHVWDEDLRELNNPLPRWWMILFVGTVVFALAYLIFYPGLGSAPGALGWSSRGQHETQVREAKLVSAPIYASFAGVTTEALARNPQAMAIGQHLFVNTCAGCHGSDARGGKGFPNLTDDDWLHGGTPADIEESITNGRVGSMPPMAAALGSDESVHDVANYVLSLSKSPHDATRAAAGAPKFVVCAACHGPDGKGNTVIGSANLTDNIWLHGHGEAAIVAMITNGKTNIMPAHKDRFTPEQIHVLAAYVWSLSHPGATVAAAAPAASGAAAR
jgi:cytochrome c oxidase cbb3-type subunit 3